MISPNYIIARILILIFTKQYATYVSSSISHVVTGVNSNEIKSSNGKSQTQTIEQRQKKYIFPNIKDSILLICLQVFHIFLSIDKVFFSVAYMREW